MDDGWMDGWDDEVQFDESAPHTDAVVDIYF